MMQAKDLVEECKSGVPALANGKGQAVPSTQADASAAGELDGSPNTRSPIGPGMEDFPVVMFSFIGMAVSFQRNAPWTTDMPTIRSEKEKAGPATIGRMDSLAETERLASEMNGHVGNEPGQRWPAETGSA